MPDTSSNNEDLEDSKPNQDPGVLVVRELHAELKRRLSLLLEDPNTPQSLKDAFEKK